jgi:thiol-disulfide isomerase/thioredoxin
MTLRLVVRYLAALVPLLAILPIIPGQAQLKEPFGKDLHGGPVRELSGTGVRVVVLYFAATDCPISNRYIPEIARLKQEFGGAGVRVWWVYPNPGDTAEVVERHRRDFSIAGDAVLDWRQRLVAMAHVGVTPEAAVFVVEGGVLREVYHGRVDDRYFSLGRERPQAGRHDLEAAIRAAVAGKPVPQPGGPPVGCSVVFVQK